MPSRSSKGVKLQRQFPKLSQAILALPLTNKSLSRCLLQPVAKLQVRRLTAIANISQLSQAKTKSTRLLQGKRISNPPNRRKVTLHQLLVLDKALLWVVQKLASPQQPQSDNQMVIKRRALWLVRKSLTKMTWTKVAHRYSLTKLLWLIRSRKIRSLSLKSPSKSTLEATRCNTSAVIKVRYAILPLSQS